MAWTTPKTWNVKDKLTAALFNTQIRDNLQALKDVLTGAANAFGTAFYPTNLANFFLFRDGASNPGIWFDVNDTLLFDRVTNTYYLRVADGNMLTVDGLGNTALNGGLTVGNKAVTKISGKNIAGFVPANGADLYIGWNLGNGTRDFSFINADSGAAAQVFRFVGFNGTALYDALNVDSGGKVGGKGFYDSGEVAIGAGAAASFTHNFGASARFLGGYYRVGAGVNLPLSLPSPTGGGAVLPYINITEANYVQVFNGAGSTVTVRVYAMK